MKKHPVYTTVTRRRDAVCQDWATQSRNDPEFGGKILDAALEIAKDVVNRYGNKELRAALNDTGMGNHPEMVRLLWKVGQALNENNKRAGRSSLPPKDWGKVFYPNFPNP